MLQTCDNSSHLCHVFETQAERWLMLEKFLLEGMQAGDLCIAALDRSEHDQLRRTLRGAGATGDQLATLELYDQNDVYLLNQYFDGERVRAFWEGVHERSVSSGRRLRIAGMGDWSARAGLAAEQIGAYESAMDPLIAEWGAVVACFYDQHGTSPAALEEVLAHHPEVQWGGVRLANPYFEPDHADGGAQRIEWRLRHLRAQCDGREQLARSERRLRHILANTADATIILGADATVRFVSPGAAGVLGVDPEQLLGLSMQSFVHHADWPRVAAAFRRVRREACASERLELRLRPVHGRVRTVEVTATNLLHDDSIGGVLVTAHDVTERAAALHALHESEERLRNLADAVHGVFWIADAHTAGPQYVNRGFETVFGRSTEEVLASPETWIDSVHEEDRERVRTCFADRSYAVECEYRIVRGDGEIRWVWDRAFPVHDAEGRLQRVVGIAEDVTDRVLASEALETQRATLQAVLDNLPVMVYVFEPAGRARLVNECWLKTLGWSPADYSDDELAALLHPDDAERERVRAFLRAASGEWEEFRTCTRSGRTIETTWAVVKLPDGKCIAIGQDNSTRVQLRQSLKLQAVGTLAGGVAHDFNNILTAILGHVDLLDEHLEQAGVHCDDVAEIRSSAERASHLTRQLLAFSRRQVLRPQPLDLRELLEDIQRMLLRVLPENIRLELNAPEPVWQVCADRTQIDQIVMNLTVNARDAMPQGGTITLATRNLRMQDPLRVRYPSLPPSEQVLLEVRDTGSGMTPELISHIFEPFFTTKAPGKGTGLGLATTHGIVAQSGGRIEVETEVGRGSIFRVFLPRVESAGVVTEAVNA